MENAYGYNDSELALVEVIAPPTFVSYPANQSGVYGDLPTLTVVTTNAPFTIRWWQGLPPFKTNSVQVQAVQSLGSSYFRKVTNSFQLPRLSPGSYTYWVEAENPSGATHGGAISVQIAQRPLTVLLTVPEGIQYDALPHAATATAMDPVAGGPPIPFPLPITITYLTSGADPSTQAPIRAGNYEVSAVVRHPDFSGTKFNKMRIDKRGLVISAQNMARLEGAENPPLSLLYSGFAGADTSAQIDGLPTVSTLADSTSPPGLYPIRLNGGSDNDYLLEIRDGGLQVLEHPVTVAFASDFSSLPSLVQLEGSAVLEEGALVLTPALDSQLGQMIIPSPDWPLRALHVSFDLSIGSGNGADGMSFNYAGDIVGVADQTPEEGIGTGLSLTADTYNNGDEQVPNLGLKYRGRFVAETVVPELGDGQARRLSLNITSAGLATLTLDGQPLWNQVPLDGWAPLPEWRLSFAARTGGLNDRHVVDNVLIGERANSLYLPQAQQTTSVELRPSLGSALENMVLSIQTNTDPQTATAALVGTQVRFTSNSGQPGHGVITVKATKPDLEALLQFNVTVTHPRLDLLSYSAQTGVGLQLSGEPGAAYYLRKSASLDSSTWSTFAAGSLGLSGLSLLTDQESGDASSLFYQSLSLPPRAPRLIALWRANGDYRDGFGSLHGIPVPSVEFVDGQRDQAFSFDGSERVLKLGGAPVPPPWTLGLWVRRQASPDASSALLADSSTALKLEQWPGTRQVGFTQFGVDDYSFGYVAPLETWVHLTFVGSGSDTRLYVNGELQATHPKSIPLPLGQLGRGLGDRLKGAVDEIRVFGSALSPTAVTDLFRATQ